MKVYYFHYKDAEDRRKTEAFTSKTNAERRISDLRKETKHLKDRMQEYVIKGKKGDRPPNYVRELPSDIKTAEFERDSQGIIEAFTFLANKE